MKAANVSQVHRIGMIVESYLGVIKSSKAAAGQAR